MTDARTRAVLGRRRSSAAGPHGKGRREAVSISQEIADYDDYPTVCRTHKRFVPCRGRGGCDITSAPADVSAVRAYQSC